MRRVLIGIAALLAVLLVSNAALAEEQTVLRVLVVKTDDIAAYAQEVEKGRTLLKKLGARATIRLWHATLAGEDTGTVVVSVEYPSLTAFAEATAKGQADAEFSAWLKGLNRIRTIVSDSLYNEIEN